MLSTHFIRRGYPLKLIENALHKAELQDRDSLLARNIPGGPSPHSDKPTTNTDKTFYLITTHNPTNPPLREIVESNWSLLNKSKTTRALDSAKLIFGKRRNKNLADHLVRASTKTIDKSHHNVENNPCNRLKNCRYCPMIDTTGTLRSTSTGKTYQSMINVNCQSSNLIYVITCRTCGIQYVGQTKNRILQRFQGHIFDINNNNDTTVARHFNHCPTEQPAQLKGIKFNVASFIPLTPDCYLAKRLRDKEEKRWMRRLRTITPYGLNLLD